MFSGAASGQVESSEREVKGPAGRDIRLNVYFSVREDCTAGPLPAIRLSSPPANGSVTVKRGKVQVTGRRNCLAAEVAGFVAFYRSKPEFSGTDEVTLEIKTQAGKTVLQKFKIIVDGPKGRSI